MPIPLHPPSPDAILPLARGVYHAVTGTTALWLAVMSTGRFWMLVDEGLDDPHLPAKVALALEARDPLPTSPVDGGSPLPARVLPFPPPLGGGLLSPAAAPRQARAEG